MELEYFVCDRATPHIQEITALLCTCMAFLYTPRIPEVNEMDLGEAFRNGRKDRAISSSIRKATSWMP